MGLPIRLKLFNKSGNTQLQANPGMTFQNADGSTGGMTNFRLSTTTVYEGTLDLSYDSRTLYELHKNLSLQGKKTLTNALSNTVFRAELPHYSQAFVGLDIYVADKSIQIPAAQAYQTKSIGETFTYNPVETHSALPFRAGVSIPVRPYLDAGKYKRIKQERDVRLLENNEELLTSLGGNCNKNGIVSSYSTVKEDGLYVKKGFVICNYKQPNLEYPEGTDRPSTPQVDYWNPATARRRELKKEVAVIADRRVPLQNLNNKIESVNDQTKKYRYNKKSGSILVGRLEYNDLIKNFTQYHEEMTAANNKIINEYIQNTEKEIKNLLSEKEYLESQLKKVDKKEEKTNNSCSDYYEEVFGETAPLRYEKSDNGINPDITAYSDHNDKIQKRIYEIEDKIEVLQTSISDDADWDSLPEVQSNKEEFEARMQKYISDKSLGTVYIDGIEKTETQIAVEQTQKGPSKNKYDQFKIEFSEEDMDVLTHAHEVIKGYETAEVRKEKSSAQKTANEVLNNFREYTLNGFITPEDKAYLENTSKENLDPERVKAIYESAQRCKEAKEEWESTYSRQNRKNWFHNIGVDVKNAINNAKGVPYVKLNGGFDVHLRNGFMGTVVDAFANTSHDKEKLAALAEYQSDFAGKTLIDNYPFRFDYTGITGFGEIGAGYAHKYFDISGGVIFRGGNHQLFKDAHVLYQPVSPFLEFTLKKPKGMKVRYDVDRMVPNPHNSDLEDAKVLSKTMSESSVTARIELVDKKPVFMFGISFAR